MSDGPPGKRISDYFRSLRSKQVFVPDDTTDAGPQNAADSGALQPNEIPRVSEIAASSEKIAPRSREPGEARSYSRAFENFVENETDIVGLLAYAYFKSSIREDARSGRFSDGKGRNPNQAQVRAFRSQAEREISGIARRAIEGATPDIEQTATANAITTTKAEIVSHITQRTGFWTAFGTNMLAWIVSLFIVGLILYVTGKPDVPAVVVDRLSGSGTVESRGVDNLRQNESEQSPDSQRKN